MPAQADRHGPQALLAWPSVLIVGRGWLATTLAQQLLERGAASVTVVDATGDGAATRLREALPEIGAVVCCGDGPTPLPAALVELCGGAIPLIAAELTAMGARIRLVNPRVPGGACVSCEREYRARRDPFDAAVARYFHDADAVAVPWRYRHAESDVALAATFIALALADAVRAAAAGSPPDTRAVALDFDERTARAHPVPRHFACAACRPHRSSAADALRDEAKERWAAAWASPQSPRDLLELHARVRQLVGGEYGLFDLTRTTGAFERHAIGSFFAERGVKPGDTPFIGAVHTTAVRWRIRGSRRDAVATGGFDFSAPRVAEGLALIEGLERLVALDYVDPSRVVRSALANIDRPAIDPRELALFSEGQRQDERFPDRRFDPQAEMRCVWGIRIASGEPILVPAQVMQGEPGSLVHATSSGAACHSSFHHAVLNGLYELIERDALMLTWLNQWSRPRIRLADTDPDPYGVRAAFAGSSFRLTHVDVTTEVGVPVVLAVLEDELDPDLFMITMVGSLSASRALEKVAREITQFTHPHLVNRSQYRTAISRSDDPAVVNSLPDHLAFYQNSSRRPLTAFLTASSDERPFAGPGAGDDLSAVQEIEEVVARLNRAGFDPVVVDCTEPFLRELGLWAVRVVVAGLQPLQVGHGRVGLGSRRLATTPNPWPHPFW